MMKALKNIGLTIILLLILSGNILALFSHTSILNNTKKSESSASTLTQEIEKPVSPVYLEIEGNNFVPNFTEFHRLALVLIHPNRIAPRNFNFCEGTFRWRIINYSSPVPIFIKGHVLLN